MNLLKNQIQLKNFQTNFYLTLSLANRFRLKGFSKKKRTSNQTYDWNKYENKCWSGIQTYREKHTLELNTDKMYQTKSRYLDKLPTKISQSIVFYSFCVNLLLVKVWY